VLFSADFIYIDVISLVLEAVHSRENAILSIKKCIFLTLGLRYLIERFQAWRRLVSRAKWGIKLDFQPSSVKLFRLKLTR